MTNLHCSNCEYLTKESIANKTKFFCEYDPNNDHVYLTKIHNGVPVKLEMCTASNWYQEKEKMVFEKCPNCEFLYCENKGGKKQYFCNSDTSNPYLLEFKNYHKILSDCDNYNWYKEKVEDYHEKKFDQGKLRYDLIPAEMLEALAEIFTYGLTKGYGEESWKTVPDAEKRYIAAFFRHFEAYRKGEPIDPESKKQHLWHALWNIGALVYFNKGK